MGEKKKTSVADVAVLVLIPLMSSFTPIAVGAARKGIPSIVGGAMRFGIAGLLIGIYLVATGNLHRIPRREWWKFVLLGIVTVPINQLAFWEGVANSDSSHGAVIYAATPVMVLVMTCLLKLEKWTVFAVAGAILAMAGVATIMGQSLLHISKVYAWGDFLLFWAALTWSMYLVAARLLGPRYGTLNVQFWTFSFGVVISIPIAGHDVARWDIGATPMGSWVGLLYLAIGVAGLIFFMFNWAMMRQPPSRVATFANCAPPLTVLWNILFFKTGHALDLWFIVGSVLLLVGMGFALWRKPEVVAEDASPLANGAELETIRADSRALERP